MTIGSTTTITSASDRLNLRMGFLNAENLFLLFDQEVPPHYLKLNEIQWQKLSSSVYENKALNKCVEIAQIIKNKAPDIMMLCEVGGLESLKNFNRLFLADQYHIALLEGNSDRNIDVGFLIKKQTEYYFDIATNKNRPLHYLYPHEQVSKSTGYPIKASSQFFSRDCAELRLFKKSKEEPFLAILLTHLKSRLDPDKIDPGGTERRSAELRTTIQIYKELRQQNPNLPLILCGDMNGFAGKPNTDTEFLPLYQDTDLEDVLELANVSMDKRSTFYQIKNNQKVDGKQIDYCFITGNLQDHLAMDSVEVYRFRDQFGFAIDQPKTLIDKSKLPSDHYPLFFTLENLNVW